MQSPEDNEVLLRQVVENWQRADLHPFEIADSLARLRDLNGYTQKQLPKRRESRPVTFPSCSSC